MLRTIFEQNLTHLQHRYHTQQQRGGSFTSNHGGMYGFLACIGKKQLYTSASFGKMKE
jgi:hypothetical protein